MPRQQFPSTSNKIWNLSRWFVTMAGAILTATSLSAGQAWAEIPNQFIAKMYTEVLGRAPDQGGWSWGVNYFSNYGCSATTLRNWGRNFYASPEYASRNYDNASKVLTLYRGILSREPEQGGFGY